MYHLLNLFFEFCHFTKIEIADSGHLQIEKICLQKRKSKRIGRKCDAREYYKKIKKTTINFKTVLYSKRSSLDIEKVLCRESYSQCKSWQVEGKAYIKMTLN